MEVRSPKWLFLLLGLVIGGGVAPQMATQVAHAQGHHGDDGDSVRRTKYQLCSHKRTDIRGHILFRRHGHQSVWW